MGPAVSNASTTQRAQKAPERLPLVLGYMAFPLTQVNTVPWNVGSGIDLALEEIERQKGYFVLGAYDEMDELPRREHPGVLCRLDNRVVQDMSGLGAFHFTPLARVQFIPGSRRVSGIRLGTWELSQEIPGVETEALRDELDIELERLIAIGADPDAVDDYRSIVGLRDASVALSRAADLCDMTFDEYNEFMSLDSIDDRYRFVISMYREILRSNAVSDCYRYLETAGMPPRAEAVFRGHLESLRDEEMTAADRQVVMSNLRSMMAIPWSSPEPQPPMSPIEARRCLDATHSGAEELKQAVLDRVYSLNWEASHPGSSGGVSPLLLVGPPGIGKTSMLFQMAKVLNRPLRIIGCSTITDAHSLTGSQRMWVGAQMGAIMKMVVEAGTTHMVLAFDEVDKFSANQQQRDALLSVLMQVTDPVRNNEFIDQYLNCPFDLSALTVVATANSVADLPDALLDRFTVLALRGYSQGEKLEIVRNHLISRLRETKGIGEEAFTISDSAIAYMIDSYDDESGVRQLSRMCDVLFSKGLREVTDGDGSVTIDEAKVREYLGTPIRDLSLGISKHTIPGTGDILTVGEDGTGYVEHVQVCILPVEDGKTVVTGSVTSVYEESIWRARDYIVANHNDLGVPLEHALQLVTKHLHVAHDGIGREVDGPSGGVSLLLAMLSYLYREPWPDDLVATGALELHGKVSSIGSLPEKLTAAARHGKKRVIIPRGNVRDLERVSADTLARLQVIPVEQIGEAVEVAFPNGPSLPTITHRGFSLRVLDGGVAGELGSVIQLAS